MKHLKVKLWKKIYTLMHHPNETRVVLKSNEKIEDYEYEGSKNNLIKNNIYLGKSVELSHLYKQLLWLR